MASEEARCVARAVIAKVMADVMSEDDAEDAKANDRLPAVLCHCELPNGSRALQYRVWQQGHWMGSACGWYALHAALCMSNGSLRDLARAAPLYRLVFDYCSSPQAYAKGGVALELERLDMQRLCDTLHPNIIYCPAISRREMASAVMTPDEVHEIQSRIDSWTETAPLAFVAGTGTHWFALVALSRRELRTAESYNTPVLGASEDALRRHARDVVEAQIPRYLEALRKRPELKDAGPVDVLLREGRPWPHRVYSIEERIEWIVSSAVDMQHSIEVLAACLTGEQRLADVYAETMIRHALEGEPDYAFVKHLVLPRLEGLDCNMPQQRKELSEWLLLHK